MTTRTTIVLERERLAELKKLALEENRTLSSVIDEFMREGLARRRAPRPKLKPLPSFNMGEELVDISNRDRLYEIMDD